MRVGRSSAACARSQYRQAADAPPWRSRPQHQTKNTKIVTTPPRHADDRRPPPPRRAGGGDHHNNTHGSRGGGGGTTTTTDDDDDGWPPPRAAAATTNNTNENDQKKKTASRRPRLNGVFFIPQRVVPSLVEPAIVAGCRCSVVTSILLCPRGVVMLSGGWMLFIVMSTMPLFLFGCGRCRFECDVHSSCVQPSRALLRH